MTARLPQLVGTGMARRLSMTGEVVDAARAERIGLVTEVAAHDQLLARAVELVTQIAEVPAPTMAAVKQIYVTGSAIAEAQVLDVANLSARYTETSERNRRQIT